MEDSDPKPVANGGLKYRKLVLSYPACAVFIMGHIGAIIGLYLALTSAKWLTLLWAYFMYVCGTLGITAGCHRLWSHRSYKAKLPLQLLLVWFNSIAFQHSIYTWSRDHRVHHKYSDTDADPYNINRGFFFAHLGWLLCKKHPEVTEKGKGVDMSDLQADKLVMWQRKYFYIILSIACYAIPTFVPMYFWNESLVNAAFVNSLRHFISLHIIMCVNSVAHWNGIRPYDRTIRPVEHLTISIASLGEGWHNFHHSFPWDYRAGEFFGFSTNFSTFFIQVMEKIGWAYDLKVATNEIIKSRVNKKGDGNHTVLESDNDLKPVPVLTNWF